MIMPTPEERADWVDLKQRYRWLYDCTLEEALITQRQDIGAWWYLGGDLKMPGRKPAGPTKREVTSPAGPSHASVSPPVSSRRSNPPAAPVSLAEAREAAQPPPRGLPPQVKTIILGVAAETGVDVAQIMSVRRTGPISDARQECYRRLRAMPWRGGHPSLLQVGLWLQRDHTTVLHGINKRGDQDGPTSSS
jgi:hypothetical protein